MRLVQEDQGKALTGGAAVGGSLPTEKMPRRGGARPSHATPPHKYHRRSATLPPPPPSNSQGSQGSGEASAADSPSTFLPRRDRPPPSANGKRDRLLFPPPAAGSSLLIVAVVCARYLSVLLIINLRDLDLCRVGVREDLARFDLRCSCSFTSYSSGTLSVLSSQWQDVSPTCV